MQVNHSVLSSLCYRPGEQREFASFLMPARWSLADAHFSRPTLVAVLVAAYCVPGTRVPGTAQLRIFPHSGRFPSFETSEKNSNQFEITAVHLANN